MEIRSSKLLVLVFGRSIKLRSQILAERKQCILLGYSLWSNTSVKSQILDVRISAFHPADNPSTGSSSVPHRNHLQWLAIFPKSSPEFLHLLVKLYYSSWWVSLFSQSSPQILVQLMSYFKIGKSCAQWILECNEILLLIRVYQFDHLVNESPNMMEYPMGHLLTSFFHYTLLSLPTF